MALFLKKFRTSKKNPDHVLHSEPKTTQMLATYPRNLQESNDGKDYSNLTVIIPTLNEEKSIGYLLNELTRRFPRIHIIVSDDGSTDSTPQEVEKIANQNDFVSLLDRKGSPVVGLTASVLDALFAVQTQFFAVMDGDLQHPIGVIPQLFDKLICGASLVSGTRDTIDINQPRSRVFATQFFTAIALINLRSRGIRVTDPLSGLFAGNTEVIRALVRNNPSKFELKGYKIFFDLLRLLPSGTKIEEISYSFLCRNSGSSKAGVKHALRFLRSLIR